MAVHEMGIADALMKTVERTVQAEGGGRVASVTVELGELSSVLPKFLLDCWKAVTDRTDFQETALHLISVPGTVKCEDCGRVSTADLERLRCPYCQSKRLTPLSGTEMLVTEIQIFEELPPGEAASTRE